MYLKNGDFTIGEIPIGFKGYNISIASQPIDNMKNIIIIPETTFHFIKKFKHIQFILWWMSVDNFYYRSSLYEMIKFSNPSIIFKTIYGRLINKKNILTGIGFKDLNNLENNFLHVYQSTYAKCTLLKNKVSDILPLSDYINSDFLEGDIKSEKQDIILYNPAKGLKFTKKIIKLLSQYRFIPLVNLSRKELANYFKISKIYIDFGNHPGKDRLPREAALYDCCIIVGKKGASAFFEDIPIPQKYKFGEDEINFITERITDTILNYEENIKDFQFYKRRVLLEKDKFYKEIEEIFNL
ncbi:hypothetical protein ACFQZF_00515 [Flavobacterium myungsuense]|uniref:hypothetical protein n=1 Tax=Flavobacterium myungsuense TaxID=651823 RepID=UPI003636E44D